MLLQGDGLREGDWLIDFDGQDAQIVHEATGESISLRSEGGLEIPETLDDDSDGIPVGDDWEIIADGEDILINGPSEAYRFTPNGNFEPPESFAWAEQGISFGNVTVGDITVEKGIRGPGGDTVTSLSAATFGAVDAALLSDLSRNLGEVRFDIGLEVSGMETGSFDTFFDDGAERELDGTELTGDRYLTLSEGDISGTSERPMQEHGVIVNRVIFSFDGELNDGSVSLVLEDENGNTVEITERDTEVTVDALETFGIIDRVKLDIEEEGDESPRIRNYSAYMEGVEPATYFDADIVSVTEVA